MSLVHQENGELFWKLENVFVTLHKRKTLRPMAVRLQGQASFSSRSNLKGCGHVHGPLENLYQENLLRGYALFCCFI